MEKLPDYLDYNLLVVFCGTAASSASAQKGHYYAGKGNKFWPTLYTIGLTPTLYLPSQDHTLPTLGIGFTDTIKEQSGVDKQINFKDFTKERLEDKIRMFQPNFLAFTSKKAAQVYLSRSKITLGLQKERIGSTQIFVLPSPSGLASGYWDIEVWKTLADKLSMGECSP